MDRALIRAGGIALAVILVNSAFEYQLPRKGFFYGDLPQDAISRRYDFEGGVRLLGFAPLETDHVPGGYVYVTLYWQAIAPPAADYSVFVHLVDQEGQKVAGLDELLGGISYPDVGTSGWHVGATLAESYLVEMPVDVPPVLEVHVGLYATYDQGIERRLQLMAADGTPEIQDFVRIGALGVLTAEPLPALEDEVENVDYVLGDALRVSGTSIPQAITSGDELLVGVQWEAVGPVSDDYLSFFHLFDADMNLVGQSDGPVLGPGWPTSALIPGQPFGATRSIELFGELSPGEYLLRMGVYEYPSLDRLAARDADGNLLTDGLIDLARFRVE